MFKVPAPNYTQTPNALFDEWLPKLKLVELRVLMVILRKTFGWHKIRDRISLTQLEKLTGSQRSDILKAAKKLEELGLVTKEVIGKNGDQETYYELVVHEDSNNSYQCESHTPPSVNLTPTKETTTKEKKKREEAQAPPPQPDFQYHKVKMSWEDLNALVKDFGRPKVDEMLDRVNEYSKINPKRFKQYACHATVIRKWIREDKEKFKNRADPVIEDNNREIAKKVMLKFPKQVDLNEIQMQEMGLLFCYGRIYELIEFKDFGFRDKVNSRLRKMNLLIDEL